MSFMVIHMSTGKNMCVSFELFFAIIRENKSKKYLGQLKDKKEQKQKQNKTQNFA